MSGIRKLIYISNEGIWESIKNSAKLETRSVSNYLVRLHEKTLDEKVKLPDDTTEKPIALTKKAVKLKKVVSTGWINPLTNTVLAPKGGK